MASSSSSDDPPATTRRRFLKIATCSVGCGLGAAIAVPAVGYLLYPVGRRLVTTGDDPIDAIAADRIVAGAPPVRVPLVAAAQRDAWTTVRDVPLGAAWLRRTDGGELVALSAVCPHLGCAVGWDDGGKIFKCPCHESAFAVDGARMAGPAERGLDPLPLTVADGRIRITWVRYKTGGSRREPG